MLHESQSVLARRVILVQVGVAQDRPSLSDGSVPLVCPYRDFVELGQQYNNACRVSWHGFVESDQQFENPVAGQIIHLSKFPEIQKSNWSRRRRSFVEGFGSLRYLHKVRQSDKQRHEELAKRERHVAQRVSRPTPPGSDEFGQGLPNQTARTQAIVVKSIRNNGLAT